MKGLVNPEFEGPSCEYFQEKSMKVDLTFTIYVRANKLKE